MKFIIFCSVCIFLAAIFMWLRNVRKMSWLWRVVFWAGVALPAILTWMCILDFSPVKVMLLAISLTVLAAPFCVMAICLAIGDLLHWRFNHPSILTRRIALVTAAITCLCSLTGLLFGWKHVVVREVRLEFPNLPQAFEGYRIALFSDLHLGTYRLSPQTVNEIVEKTNALSPDLILCCGDIINVFPNEFASFADVIGELKAKDGVFSVLGNHDYCGYWEYDKLSTQIDSLNLVKKLYSDAGIDLLLNDHRIIRQGADSLAVLGVENSDVPPYPSYSNPMKASEGLQDDAFKILMAHTPAVWRDRVLPYTDIDLTLSGHTHGMQLRIGKLSPARLIGKEWGGLYSEGEQKLFITTGAGSNIPFRFGAWPEIVLIELAKK